MGVKGPSIGEKHRFIPRYRHLFHMPRMRFAPREGCVGQQAVSGHALDYMAVMAHQNKIKRRILDAVFSRMIFMTASCTYLSWSKGETMARKMQTINWTWFLCRDES